MKFKRGYTVSMNVNRYLKIPGLGIPKKGFGRGIEGIHEPGTFSCFLLT